MRVKLVVFHPTLCLNIPHLEKLGEGKYEDLFIAALRYHGMLCIGLYRYLDLDSEPASRTSRYVITNPPGTFDLHPMDKIFVFMPYE